MSATRALLAVTLAHGFGGDSPRPLRAAWWRLGSFVLGAAVLGLLLGETARRIPGIALPHPELLAISAALIIQWTIGFTLLVASGATRAQQQEVFAQLLLIWPLAPWQRWLAFMLPKLVLGALALIMFVWPLGLLFGQVGLPWPWLVGATIIGYASAFGLVQSPFRRRPGLVALWAPGILLVEYLGLRWVNDPSATVNARYLAALGLLGVFAILAQCAFAGQAALRSYLTRRSRHQTVRPLPPRWWLVAKLSRRASFVISIGVALAFSIGLSLAAHRLHFDDLEVLALFTALLAASVTADLRGTVRRINPAEITALRGTVRFVGLLVGVAVAVGLVVALPVVVGFWPALVALSPATGWHLGLELAVGLAAGLLAGGLLVPQNRDISGQFMAILLVMGILLVVPNLLGSLHLNLVQRNVLDALTGLILLVGLFGIELKRNPYGWRKAYGR